MFHLSKRLDRLEAQRGGDAVAVPSVIYICEADGEAMAALFSGSTGASRLEGETESNFMARVEEMMT